MKKWLFVLVCLGLLLPGFAEARQNLSAEMRNGGGTSPWALDRFVTGGDSQDDDCSGNCDSCCYDALADGDSAIVFDYANQIGYFYVYDADSAQTEDGFVYITPDYTEAVGTPTEYTGDARWVLLRLDCKGGRLYGALNLNSQLIYDAANAFGAADTTPDVSGGTVFKTGGAVTITDFDDGTDHTNLNDGQLLIILAQHAGTLDFTSSQLNGHGEVDYTMSVGDMIFCMFDDTVGGDGQWLCQVPGPKKLENCTFGGFTANRAIETDGSGNQEASQVTDTELALLDGKTGLVQPTECPLDSDFGSNGLMERTGAGTYGIATEGTDYYKPGGTDVTETDIVAAITRDTEVPGLTSSKSDVIFCFNLHDPDDTMDYIKKQFPRAMTITKVTMKCDGGTNVIGRLYEVDGDGDGSDKVGIETTDWTVTTTETEDTSFNNATLDAGDYLSWYTTSVSGSVVNFVVTVEGYET